MKKLFQNITTANILLLAAAIFMASYWLMPFAASQSAFSPPPPKPKSPAAEADHGEFSPPSSADYAVIPDENLFHPDRIIPPEKKAEQDLPKPEFVLFGTMISDDVSLAFVEDARSPRSTPGRGKRQISLKKGDMLSGYILKEIEQDKIVMVRGEDQMTVSVVDARKPKTREAVSTAGIQPPVQPAQQPAVSAAPAPRPQRQALSRAASRPQQPDPSSPPLAPADEKIRQLMGK